MRLLMPTRSTIDLDIVDPGNTGYFENIFNVNKQLSSYLLDKESQVVGHVQNINCKATLWIIDSQYVKNILGE